MLPPLLLLPHHDMGTCEVDVATQNFNGPVLSSVDGIKSAGACCDSCALVPKCVRWVYGPNSDGVDCNLLSAEGMGLIGSLNFVSGHVTHGYTPAPPPWGPSFLVGLGVVVAVYLVGGMVRAWPRPPCRARCALTIPSGTVSLAGVPRHAAGC